MLYAYCFIPAGEEGEGDTMTDFGKLVKYVLIWAVIALFVILMAVVKYWDEIGEVIGCTVSSVFGELLYIAILIIGIGMIIRSVWR